MLFLNVERLLRLRNIRYGRSYLINNGYTDSEARLLVSGKMKLVKLRMLERLCVTFNCSIHELFDWSGSADHPLAGLRKSATPDIMELLADRTPEEIEMALRRIRDRE